MATGVAELGMTTAEYEEALQKKMRDGAEKKLEAVKEELKSVGLKVSVKIPEGIPFKEILRIAEEEDVSRARLAREEQYHGDAARFGL